MHVPDPEVAAFYKMQDVGADLVIVLEAALLEIQQIRLPVYRSVAADSEIVDVLRENQRTAGLVFLVVRTALYRRPAAEDKIDVAAQMYRPAKVLARWKNDLAAAP